MKVYNQEKTLILNEYDLNKGYLVDDYIDIPEVKGIEEQGHYETIKEYKNGGKDIEWVVDVEGIEYQPARREEIQVYIPYTAKELDRFRIERQIEELKQNLSSTDYKAIKYAEGELSANEYAPIKSQRRQWRAEINKLEKTL